jgi:peptide-methionine (S)-S-oxide reductase
VVPDPSGSAWTPDLGALVDRVPAGWTSATYDGRRWGLRREDRADGRVVAVFAEELGGRRVVSANVYRTGDGDLLRPCEMPASTVLAFLRGWSPA